MKTWLLGLVQSRTLWVLLITLLIPVVNVAFDHPLTVAEVIAAMGGPVTIFVFLLQRDALTPSDLEREVGKLEEMLRSRTVWAGFTQFAVPLVNRFILQPLFGWALEPTTVLEVTATIAGIAAWVLAKDRSELKDAMTARLSTDAKAYILPLG